MLDRSCEALAVRQFETEKPEAPPAHPTICRSFLIGANVANIVGERGVPLFSPKLLEVSFDLINLTSPSEASAFYSTGGHNLLHLSSGEHHAKIDPVLYTRRIKKPPRLYQQISAEARRSGHYRQN